MRGFVSPTDHGWYQFLLARSELSEVNFWRPGGGSFAALQPGEPFFFKLKAPYNAIGGFGLFARFARLPVWRAGTSSDRPTGPAMSTSCSAACSASVASGGPLRE